MKINKLLKKLKSKKSTNLKKLKDIFNTKIFLRQRSNANLN